jgi:hypothetical protein
VDIWDKARAARTPCLLRKRCERTDVHRAQLEAFALGQLLRGRRQGLRNDLTTKDAAGERSPASVGRQRGREGRAGVNSDVGLQSGGRRQRGASEERAEEVTTDCSSVADDV